MHNGLKRKTAESLRGVAANETTPPSLQLPSREEQPPAVLLGASSQDLPRTRPFGVS